MGTDIVGLIGNTSKFPPSESLIQRLREDTAGKNQLIKGDWRLDYSYQTDSLSRITDSLQLSIIIGHRAALILSNIDWMMAAYDPGALESVIPALTEIARFFGSPFVVLLPDDIKPWCDVDDWVEARSSLEEILSKLEKLRSPSAELKNTVRSVDGGYKVDGYVVLKV